METKEIISIKKDLELFEIEKNKLLELFNKQINNKDNKKVNSYMAAIVYEYRRLEAQSKLRAIEKNPMCETEEGRTKLLLDFIENTFSKNQIQEIIDTLRTVGYNEIPNTPQLVKSIMPVVEEFAKPVLDEINSLKKDMQELYLKHNIPFMHISPADIKEGCVNPSKDLENQPQNAIVTGVFAASSYHVMNLYMARATAGGMIVDKDKVQYPKNPFLSIDKQDCPNRIKLLKPIYAYALDANEFEPQLHFAPTSNGFMLLFEDEWVKQTDTPLPFKAREIITEVDSEPFFKVETKFEDEKNIPSFRDEFAKKFNIMF